MTYTEAKRTIQSLGLRITKTEYDEFRVALANNSEASAYYATDLDDAVGTAFSMGIRAGDAVTIRTPQAQERTGRAVMRGPHGWVLNMGGAHGTPAVADLHNIVRVSRKR